MRGRALGVLTASALAVGGMFVMAGPASAATRIIKCGQTISGNVKAANSIGPCLKGDAIKITTSGTTFDLGGHTILCNNANNHAKLEQIGVHLIGVSGVTVSNGTVANCDAGVAIDGGANNTVTGITAHDNIAHVLVTGPVNPKNPLGTPCNFGDGITTNDSNGNHITGNVVFHNGPYSGISLVGASSSNVVKGNQVSDQTVSNELPNGLHNPPNPDGSPGDTNGPCGPFSATPTGEGRLHQDIGIRVEGPGATNNSVIGNQSTGNQLNGISIHGYVCLNGAGPTPPPGSPPRGIDNSGNLILGNSVSGNGFADGIDGIGILSQGPLGTVTCASSGNTIRGNQSTGNARDGIFVAATGDNSKPSNNTIDFNNVDNNGRDGIHLAGPFTVCPLGVGNSGPPNFTCDVPREPRNGSNNNTLESNQGHGNGSALVAPAFGHDGFDGNPACDNNDWDANIFGTVNQPCVAADGGTGSAVGLPPPPFP